MDGITKEERGNSTAFLRGTYFSLSKIWDFQVGEEFGNFMLMLAAQSIVCMEDMQRIVFLNQY